MQVISPAHWWSILDIEPRNDIFFFDSFGLDCLKHFIIQDDKKIVDKILLGIEQMRKLICLAKQLEISFSSFKHSELN